MNKEELRTILKEAKVVMPTITNFLGGKKTKPLKQTLGFEMLYNIWKNNGVDGVCKMFEYTKSVKGNDL